MNAIDFQAIRAIGRDCPHTGCGVVFEIAPHQLASLDPSREYRCSVCQAIIEWAEIRRIRRLLELIGELRDAGARHRILAD